MATILWLSTFESIILWRRPPTAVSLSNVPLSSQETSSRQKQCLSAFSNCFRRRSSPKIATSLKILENDQPVRQSVVGRKYTVELDLPYSGDFRVGACIAFSGEKTVRFVPLLDNQGCPVEDVMTPFYAIYGTRRLRAELTMFRFNQSAHFHIQCLLKRCEQRCDSVDCRNNRDANLLGPTLLLQNQEEVIASSRVTVLDKLTTLALEGNNCTRESGLETLIVIMAALAIISFFTCLLAAYNRPFRCQVLPRDSTEELIQIVEEPIEEWTLAMRRRKPLALPPPSAGLLITALPSTISSLPGQSETKGIVSMESASATPNHTISRRYSDRSPPSPPPPPPPPLDSGSQMYDAEFPPPPAILLFHNQNLAQYPHRQSFSSAQHRRSQRTTVFENAFLLLKSVKSQFLAKSYVVKK